MGFLDKVKNMFIEEIEDGDDIKKEVIQVKIPSKESDKKVKEEKPDKKSKETPKAEKIEKKAEVQIETAVHDTDELPIMKKESVEEEVVIEEETDGLDLLEELRPAEKEKPLIPSFFDDRDFEMLEKEPLPQYGTQDLSYKRPDVAINSGITGYNGNKKIKEEKKVFVPTPIISPVYGVLDKNYKKDEIPNKQKEEKPKAKKKVEVVVDQDHLTVDDIRMKAFGTLEDELENTFEYDEKLTKIEFEPEVELNDDVELQENIDIFEEMNTEEAEVEMPVEDMLNKNYDEYEEELSKVHTDDLNDSDLFNLIDSMYDKKDDE